MQKIKIVSLSADPKYFADLAIRTSLPLDGAATQRRWNWSLRDLVVAIYSL